MSYQLKPPPPNKIYNPISIREKLYIDLQNIYDSVEIDAFNDGSSSWIVCENEDSKIGVEFSFNYEGTVLEQVALYDKDSCDHIYRVCNESRHIDEEKEKLYFPLNQYYNVQNNGRENNKPKNSKRNCFRG